LSHAISAVLLTAGLPRPRDGSGTPQRPARMIAVKLTLEERGWLGYEPREAPPAPDFLTRRAAPYVGHHWRP